MTNLIEKSLIVGFGIFTLIIFITLISPFFKELNSSNNEDESDSNLYSELIKELDYSIKYVSLNEAKIEKLIEYPEDLNISIYSYYIRYEYINNQKHNKDILDYEFDLCPASFKSLPSGTYLLSVELKGTQISINFTIFNN